MANRRMFSLDVVDTDNFLEMPVSSQSLYFHLGMHADDDGFIASPKKIVKGVNCCEDDLRVLASKGYIIPFESGVIVISDWNVNNYIKKDRYHETRYTEEKGKLILDNSVYKMVPTFIQNGSKMEPDRSQPVSKMEPEVRLGKDSIDKNSINTNSASDNAQRDSKAEINTLFESAWKLYPNKKGKGQVSSTKKRELLKIGLDELARAIERYKQDLANDEWRKPQNGSTFFNSGYIDYLDANYSEKPGEPEKEEGNSYDDSAIIRRVFTELEEEGVTTGDNPNGPFR